MKMCLRTELVACIAATVFLGAALATAADKEGKAKSPPAKNGKEPTKQMTYLGVAVEPLHPGFWAHLKDVLEFKQGVMIADVAKDSPADKAGLKPYDIIMTFGDQKLFSPEQLAVLVHTDKSGQQVKLGIVHEGKTQELMVTLGQHAVPAERRTASRPTRSMPTLFSRAPAQKDSAWERFDSISIKDLGNDRYRVQIGYETEDGKIEHRTFEGTREEIRNDIVAQKDVPADEQDDLLRSLDMEDEDFAPDFGVPEIYLTPDGRVIWDFGRINTSF